MLRIEEILNFWFGSSKEPEYGKPRQVWFIKDLKFDREIRSRFLSDYNLADRQQSVKLFEQLRDDPDSASCIAYAIEHQQIIQRFGRFPHRNQILGRDTTPEEAEFLQQPGSSF